MNKILLIIILILVCISIYYLYKNTKENYTLVNATRIGTAPTCNPKPEDCTSNNSVMIGTCYTPAINTIVSGPCRKDNCDNGYHAFCVSKDSIYPISISSKWMGYSSDIIGNIPFNQIKIPGSHDTATYDILIPKTGGAAFAGFVGKLDSIIATILLLFPPLAILGIPAFNATLGNELYHYLDYGTEIPSWGFLQYPQLDPKNWNENNLINYITDAGLMGSILTATTPSNIDSLTKIMKGTIALWGRAQNDDITTQLNNGIRYFDFRIGVDTKEGTVLSGLDLSSLKFIHTLFTQNSVTKLFDDIKQWINSFTTPFNEILIFDFQNVSNFLYAKNAWDIEETNRLKIQTLFLDYLKNTFGELLFRYDTPITSTYNELIQTKGRIFVLFSNNSYINPARAPTTPPAYYDFISNYQQKYPFIRDRTFNIVSKESLPNTPTNTSNDPNEVLTGLQTTSYTSCLVSPLDPKDPYSLPILPVLNVLQGVGCGFPSGDFVSTIINSLTNPSDIAGPNGLLPLSMKHTPFYITNILPPPYNHTDGGPVLLPPTKGAYNIIIGDNICAFNFSSLIIAWNRNELDIYGMKAINTTNDNQCHCQIDSGAGQGACGVCYTDPAGYDDTTCIGVETACYSTTAPQCRFSDDCHVIGGGAVSDTGGALYCKYNAGSSYSECKNPTLRTCRMDSECKLGPNGSSCVSSVPGVNDDLCVNAGAGQCTCDNPDPLAPQCMGDSDCGYGSSARSFSRDPSKGSHNCRILDATAQSWCATPMVQCNNDNQCHYNVGPAYCTSDTAAGYKCEVSGIIGTQCDCSRDLPADVVNYDPNNPNNYNFIPRSFCNDHGTPNQINKTCVCDQFYSGLNCETADFCLNNTCSGHGTCTNGKCVCVYGWTGKDCAEKNPVFTCNGNPQHPCTPNGTCNSDNICECKPGWYGPGCCMNIIDGCISPNYGCSSYLPGRPCAQ